MSKSVRSMIFGCFFVIFFVLGLGCENPNNINLGGGNKVTVSVSAKWEEVPTSKAVELSVNYETINKITLVFDPTGTEKQILVFLRGDTLVKELTLSVGSHDVEIYENEIKKENQSIIIQQYKKNSITVSPITEVTVKSTN